VVENYTLTVKNESTESGIFVIYQHDPMVDATNVSARAWLSLKADPTTTVSFKWNTQMNFVWREGGGGDGPGQTWDADVTGENAINFNKVGDNYAFADQRSDKQSEGSLLIQQGSQVVEREAYVGIGMSGSPTFMRQSETDAQIIFSPSPKYFILFADVDAKTVLDVDVLKRTQAEGKVFEVRFAQGGFEGSVIYQGNGTWSEMA
jgi:hypothetical protein